LKAAGRKSDITDPLREADSLAVSVLLKENDFEIGHSLSASKRIAIELNRTGFCCAKVRRHQMFGFAIIDEQADCSR
jgi:hypothetical protein